jgi:hypothetical protein
MVQVSWKAGIASARRMLPGNAASVAAAMPVVAVPVRNSRRVVMIAPDEARRAPGVDRLSKGSAWDATMTAKEMGNDIRMNIAAVLAYI